MGSEGIGGRRYQITAVVLTYMAVSLAVLPIIFWQAAKQRDAHAAANIESSASQQNAPNASNRLPADATPAQAWLFFMKGIVILLGIGLASPFLALNDPFSGAIGLFILFIGMKIAWKMTAGQPIEIHGPYQSASPALDQVSAG